MDNLRAYDLYLRAANIGSAEGMCCAGILLYEGKVESLKADGNISPSTAAGDESRVSLKKGCLD